MNSSQQTDAPRLPTDRVLTDIANYTLDYKIEDERAFDTARLCLADTLGCALDAIDSVECMKMVGPVVPGTVVPHGSRVPGTQHVLDPVTATFSFGCMVRWLDFNDTFAVATGGHPSDNLAGILMLADHLSRQRKARGGAPILVRDVLDLMIRAYEIQGCISLENELFVVGTDHNVLVRVATAAVLARMLGGDHEQVISAVSNAWIDCSLVLYRMPPNTGSRKCWASADASAQALRMAMMAMNGEAAYQAVVTARQYGFQDARLAGKQLKFQRPYGEYVIQNSTFKLAPAGMHGQTAIECAFRLHPLVVERVQDISRITVSVHRDTMRIMHHEGPLRNPSARDHCVEYVIAVGLIHGQVSANDFEDEFAADPRIDQLREKMVTAVDPEFTKDFDDPAKRSSRCAVQVWFKDGTSTPKTEVEYPLGHHLRRDEARPALRAKFDASLVRRFPKQRCEEIHARCDDGGSVDRMPVDDFVRMFIA